MIFAAEKSFCQKTPEKGGKGRKKHEKKRKAKKELTKGDERDIINKLSRERRHRRAKK